MGDENNSEVVVCKIFLLHTLGYSSDKVITVTLNSRPQGSLTPPADMRGKHRPAHKLPELSLNTNQSHIKSYHPCVSHYRREHAPRRLYLPPELSITEMHNDYKPKAQNPVCYETCRSQVAKMNIRFVKLEEEECKVCTQYNQVHEHSDNEITNWNEHIERGGIPRRHYCFDSEEPYESSTAHFSVNQQKRIMLPRLPCITTCVLTKRIIAFNETFAPLGGKRKSKPGKPIGILWHEAVTGRDAEDIASAYYKLIRNVRHRDCSMNQKSGPDTITIKYFEKGHTFMSADSFHHLVERKCAK